jgi:hypothetical protein
VQRSRVPSPPINRAEFAPRCRCSLLPDNLTYTPLPHTSLQVSAPSTKGGGLRLNLAKLAPVLRYAICAMLCYAMLCYAMLC